MSVTSSFGNQQTTNMQMEAFLVVSTNVVDDCRKHARIIDTSHAQPLSVDIYFECSHERHFTGGLENSK